MRLGAALAAPNASRPYGDLGLYNLIPRALGIGFWLHKADQAVALVGLQDLVKGQGHHQPTEDNDDRCLLPAEAA